ncbi:uncharacterized protein CLUP02_11198 [Colletotrichum lupini]|uniref:Uncharacterized protein n=1 Tax=Colletotrichum lupini TaxID=145971 RepID=A0A9Q8SY69_9PEZI|nr:uncharacterized protein CLUP02_11198 [Colletotrichum lupini]UQC85699.1 hypothetical protein CLUP02_11198 [Colletotrichum lupini]
MTAIAPSTSALQDTDFSALRHVDPSYHSKLSSSSSILGIAKRREFGSIYDPRGKINPMLPFSGPPILK